MAFCLTAQELHKTYGSLTVLEGVSLTIQPGERVGLVGANGSGKTTLGRILCGVEEADSGQVTGLRDARVALLAQGPRFEAGRTAQQEVLAGLEAWTEACQRHEQAGAALEQGQSPVEGLLAAQSRAAADVERLGGWDMGHLAEAMLGRLGVQDQDARLGSMSGGEQRRVALARVLVSEPDLAVLDEPTNHLDIDTVEWLEQHLLKMSSALLLITHDRYLLDRVATRMLEIHRGQLYSYDVSQVDGAGAYETFLEAKAERLAQAARVEANRQNFLRRELEWVRRQPKARRGKQKARTRRAEAALDQQPVRQGRALRLDVDSARAGKSILELQDLGFDAGGQALVRGLDFILTRGQRVGVIGPNGCGKTTLLRTVLGQHPAAEGKVVLGKNARPTYLSQARDDLDDRLTAAQNVAGDGQDVRVGEQWIDVRSYLARFLFTPEALRQPVGSLSGGERTRVLLARLLCQSTNLLLLDEPTNDLDVSTLSALEQLLVEFEGTAVVVTHDRWFLDRVATALLVFEPDGRVTVHAGNYSLYRELRRQQLAEAAQAHRQQDTDRKQQQRQRPAAPRKRRALTYAERLELEQIEPSVEQAEQRVAELEARLADPQLYQRPQQEATEVLAQLEQARAEAARLFARWEELETKRSE